MSEETTPAEDQAGKQTAGIPPAIIVFYNPATQQIAVKPNPSIVLNWAFASALLGMAQKDADMAERLRTIEEIENQKKEAMLNQQIRQELQNKKIAH